MDSDHHQQVFLGGASGATTWRKRIAIPALQAAGVTYFDPQLGVGEWTQAREEVEMQAKAAADVLLFVINQETRGVASIAEVAYYLGSGRRLALTVTDIGDSDTIDGRVLESNERKDLNRGRIFLRTMAQERGVPVFPDVDGAVRTAIQLVQVKAACLNTERLRAILAGIRFKAGSFRAEEIAGGFLIQLSCEETDVASGSRQEYSGRKWHIAGSASESDVVRAAFQAAAAWQEHETREEFTYQGSPVFSPHHDVEALSRLSPVKRPSQQDPQ